MALVIHSSIGRALKPVSIFAHTYLNVDINYLALVLLTTPATPLDDAPL
jgi:hypothetical protein